MIWVKGEIVPDDALTISVLDRTFEHGQGLFETLRTWNGHATLLDRHMARLRDSAFDLRLPLDPHDLPDRDAVAALLAAEGIVGDARIRVTMSGGLSGRGTATLWVRAFPLAGLPELLGHHPFLAIALPDCDLDWLTVLGRHKTLNYWRRQMEFDRHGTNQGGREAVVMAPDGMPVEGTRTNVFLVEGDTVRTADLSYPILPGIMRGVVIERARAMGITVEEFECGPPVDASARALAWTRATEVFLTNSVRGIVPVPRVEGKTFPSPGPVTERIWRDVRAWLERGGVDP